MKDIYSICSSGTTGPVPLGISGLLRLAAGLLIGIALPWHCLLATPYWNEQDYQEKQSVRQYERCTSLVPVQPRIADAYALLYEYVQICDFLTTMQELDPLSPDYGGMHEGESPDLWAIIETDNTQESIRVWSTFAELSGDLETYRSHIEAAWFYTMNNPAYDEEGTVSDYYRVHNCGWALVAESKYRQVYSDSSYLWYADSCAAYIRAHRLGYTGYTSFYNSLHPLVEGWAAGTLYDYGIEQGDQESVNHALEVGSDVQAWIEADTTRLSTNEVWAMSGGTAMWGVCRSVFADDPSAGQLWLPEQLPYMDTYAGPGEWNNSWNVWYAHAYHAAAGVLSDPTCTGYAYALVDTLLDADTDNDGGIMATSTDSDTEDQSWVSCYLDYMGLSYFIYEFPSWDATALDFLQPDTLLPIAEGLPYEVSVMVANTGLSPFGSINVSVSGAFSGSGSAFLDFADVDTIYLGEWTPSAPGPAELTMTISPGGELSANDTLTLPVNILGWGEISGTVTDAASGVPISAMLFFYLEGMPPGEPLFTASTDPTWGTYQVAVIEGTYRVVIDPEIPYTDREISNVEVAQGQTVNLDFELTPAPILLVDDDEGALYDTCYSGPLANAGYDVYVWDNYQSGTPAAEIMAFEAVVWITGNALDSALTSTEQAALAQFLDMGGGLLISGQNIAENIAGEAFLLDYLGAAFEGPNAAQQLVNGMGGDPVTAGMTIMFPGAGGAGNQTSPDMISPAGLGELSMFYPGGSQPGAAVRVESGYKSLFLAFGLEGASGAAGTTTRQQFLEAAMEWFDVPTNVQDLPAANLPKDYSTMQLSPNPFNPDVQLRFVQSRDGHASLQVYNLQGRLVNERNLGWIGKGIHQLELRFGTGFGSGVYFFVLHGPDARSVVKGVLLK